MPRSCPVLLARGGAIVAAALLAAGTAQAQGTTRKAAARKAVSKPTAAAEVPPAVPTSLPTVATAAAEDAEPAARQVAMLAGVVEDSIGTPIMDAEIAVIGTALRTRSGSGGTWRLSGVEPGPVLVSARRVGYLPQTLTVHLKEGETRALDLTLNEVMARPYVLPDVMVFTPPRTFRSVFHQGFYSRKLSYPGGTFFTREDLMAFKPQFTSDVFRSTPGFYQYRDRRGQSQWVMRGATTSSNCPIRFFIDGTNIPLNGMSIDELVQPSDIEGIEIYRGASTVPAEFSGRSIQDDSRCGVVAVWTRVTR